MRVRNRFEESKFTALIFILPFVLFGFQSIGYSQNTKPDENKQNETQEDVIRVDTNLVTVPISVLDREGRFVTNLKKEDFQVFENGIKQEVANFDSVEQPFTVFLLLDVSGSMTYYMAELTKAADAFVSQLRPDDQLAAATFADNLYVLLRPTKVGNLKKGVKPQQRFGDSNTRIYDAVDDALKIMRKIRGRKAIVLFSDGGGDGTYASAKSNFRIAEEDETIIYTVQFKNFLAVAPPNVNKKLFYESIEQANEYMRVLAQISGGRPYQIDKINDLAETFGEVANELGRQYSLGYCPNQSGKEGERRQIKVRVKIPNVAVRARDSYIVGNSKKAGRK